MLDRTQQRILGVLIEKDLSVPESYPMTENALLLGCNQKSNRDPEMSLEVFEVTGALMAMQLEGWVARVEGSRVPRFKHLVEAKLGLDAHQRAVVAELLLRGPQAVGALKPRVARMGFGAEPDAIEALLVGLGRRTPPLAEKLELRPRERDPRWAHMLGPRDAAPAATGGAALRAAPALPAAPTPGLSMPRAPELEQRVAQLESEVASLAETVADLRRRLGP